MKEKSKFISNELKSAMSKELLITDSLSVNVKGSNIFISESKGRES